MLQNQNFIILLVGGGNHYVNASSTFLEIFLQVGVPEKDYRPPSTEFYFRQSVWPDEKQ